MIVRSPVSAPIPSAEQMAGSPGVTTTVVVGAGFVGGAVCGTTGAGGAVGVAVCAGNVGPWVGGGVAWVGSGTGAAVVGATVVVGDSVGGGVVVVVEAAVMSGIVSSGVASRESAHDVISAPASNVAATLHRGRTVNVVGSATRPVSARTIRWCGHPSSRSLVHCGDVPDKRFVVLTALAVVAGAMVAVSAAGDGSGGPTDVQPAPDESPVEVGPAISVATSSTSSTTSTSTTSTTIDPDLVARTFPVDSGVNSSFTPQAHSSYRATDIFSSAGCGSALVAPVTGTVDEVVTNTWDQAVDDPATRGGNAVSILGDDGVRYYLAHFQVIDAAIVPGASVVAGDYLGEMGDTGRAGACHVHFGLSLPCPNREWWVRRGVIWPDEYLAAWQQGTNLSPLDELQAWFAEYPDACRSVEDTPYPVG